MINTITMKTDASTIVSIGSQVTMSTTADLPETKKRQLEDLGWKRRWFEPDSRNKSDRDFRDGGDAMRVEDMSDGFRDKYGFVEIGQDNVLILKGEYSDLQEHAIDIDQME